ncbi:MAG: hypothetical protein N2170_01575 [Bacteroidia bacterium]|nr:hypothetical protein [Bacteroidia bacterium]
MRKRALLLWGWAAGCASIQPPDGGPPDRVPPQPSQIRILRSRYSSSLLLRLKWGEYLSPTSSLSGVGLWVNPPHPLQARLRGKVLRIRVDSLSPEECLVVWGGPGLKDFTEGNPFSPRPLWRSCKGGDTLLRTIGLLPQPSSADPIWGCLYNQNGTYRFAGWQGALHLSDLPEGIYRGWAWEDKDQNNQWNITEPIWLPLAPLHWPPISPDSIASPLDTSYAAPSAADRKMGAWLRWSVDTLPPLLPRSQLIDSSLGLLVFAEPITLLHATGEVRPLSERALLVRDSTEINIADTLGNGQRFFVSFSQVDTQNYKPTAFWPTSANATTPYLFLTWPETLCVRDTFWVGRKGDSLYIADACFQKGEIWLSPLPTSGEVSVFFRTAQNDTFSVRLPTRKYPVALPIDTSVKRWRVYGSPVLSGAPYTEALPGDTLWLCAGSYSLLGLPTDTPFWRPVELDEGKPILSNPPSRLPFPLILQAKETEQGP